MIIQQFRRPSINNIVILAVLVFILRLNIFIYPPTTAEYSFYEPFVRLLLLEPPKSPFLPVTDIFFAFILTLIQAFLINQVVNKYNLLGKNSLFPALSYLVLSALLEPFMTLSPAMLAVFLLIWMIDKLLSIPIRHDLRSLMYDMGLIVGLGTLIYFPFILIFPLLYITLLILRPFHWREWAIGLLGFATIYFLLAVFYYLNDSIERFLDIWQPLVNPIPQQFKVDITQFFVILPALMILLFALLSLRERMHRAAVDIRKSYQILLAVFILSILSVYLRKEVKIYHFILTLPTASVFMAHYFLYATKRWVYESLFTLLVLFIIYFQWF